MRESQARWVQKCSAPVTYAVRKKLLIGRWQKEREQGTKRENNIWRAEPELVGVSKVQEIELNYESITKYSKSDSKWIQNSHKIFWGPTISNSRKVNLNKVFCRDFFYWKKFHSVKNLQGSPCQGYKFQLFTVKWVTVILLRTVTIEPKTTTEKKTMPGSQIKRTQGRSYNIIYICFKSCPWGQEQNVYCRQAIFLEIRFMEQLSKKQNQQKKLKTFFFFKDNLNKIEVSENLFYN